MHLDVATNFWCDWKIKKSTTTSAHRGEVGIQENNNLQEEIELPPQLYDLCGIGRLCGAMGPAANTYMTEAFEAL